MWIDAATIPLGLNDADNFTALKVVALREEHLWLHRDDIVRLAGDRAGDAGWLGRLDQMLGYAASRGWVNADGAVRAHVEWL
jgi:hypothetical protein